MQVHGYMRRIGYIQVGATYHSTYRQHITRIIGLDQIFNINQFYYRAKQELIHTNSLHIGQIKLL